MQYYKITFTFIRNSGVIDFRSLNKHNKLTLIYTHIRLSYTPITLFNFKFIFYLDITENRISPLNIFIYPTLS